MPLLGFSLALSSPQPRETSALLVRLILLTTEWCAGATRDWSWSSTVRREQAAANILDQHLKQNILTTMLHRPC